jgi:hypothetical protein
MRYYKQIKDNYIMSININSGGIVISEEEYNSIKNVIDSIPKKNGYGYKLKTDLTIEEYVLPAVEEEAEEATEQDYINALKEMGVSFNE